MDPQFVKQTYPEKEELLPHDPNNLIEFIEALELDWEIVRDDY